ncbi:MAG TPA: hypothetical protein VHD56_13825 [Tepidisphaeraceae bacterium]|nr:hypothetical protein [Tepidisphaeraceae bacterium]
MGPNYEKGSTRLGRNRLPQGVVAILDDAATLNGAIEELHHYASESKSPNRPRRGIIFRVVTPGEREAFIEKLIQFFGSKNLASQLDIYSYPVGHPHLIDDSLMSHASNRHSIETVHGHIAVTIEDYLRIPEIVRPKYIREFAFTRQMPRIVYERMYNNCTIVVIQEIQAKAGLSVKTIYKKR